jgi:biotin carboxyl carrier protein
MPGLVVKVLVAEGEKVKQGAKLIILEAMKMENEIRTAADSEVAELLVREGQIVEKDQTILRLK